MDRRNFIQAIGMSTMLSRVPLGAFGQVDNLAQLTPGHTKAANALWSENPLSVRFVSSRRVVVAEIDGPGEITMMHFADARTQLGQNAHLPLSSQVGNGRPLSRELLLRIYWDGESEPSVDCPFVDFFCNPDDARKLINTAFVNVNRGFNAYFPMPFRKSARVELVYDGPFPPGEELARMMPCYSYVCYRTLEAYPEDDGYFHASWRQQSLLLGLKDYVALEATGKGKFVGWNVTVRGLEHDSFPVDENEKFYIDGERTPSVEFQGLEDSFGFSWGFPDGDTFFPRTGYFKLLKGAAAYRFFTQDAISFEQSLRIAIGFGVNEDVWRTRFSKPDTIVQFSSTVYWYQNEPHAPLPQMPPAGEREPAISHA
jgi:Protein of unknown function (DUF2961)